MWVISAQNTKDSYLDKINTVFSHMLHAPCACSSASLTLSLQTLQYGFNTVAAEFAAAFGCFVLSLTAQPVWQWL